MHQRRRLPSALRAGLGAVCGVIKTVVQFLPAFRANIGHIAVFITKKLLVTLSAAGDTKIILINCTHFVIPPFLVLGCGP